MKAPFKIKSELVVAFAAIFISFATLFVYIYQANIMREQQHATVWPYLEWLPSWGNHGVYLEVKNKGVGPAIVKDIYIEFDGKKFDNFREMIYSISDTIGNNLSYSSINNRVIAPNESIKPFSISDKTIGYAVKDYMLERDFKFEICYCSVYGDCWKTKGTSIEESNCN